MNPLQRLLNRLRGNAPQNAKTSESDVLADPATANTRGGGEVGIGAADEPENEETGAEARAAARAAQRRGLPGDTPR